MENHYSPAKYKAEKAVGVLIAETEEIQSVTIWAEKVCMSQSWLRKLLRYVYDKSPKQIHREIRFETVVCLISEYGWEVSADAVAIDSGVGKNCKALHKFLRRHYDITFTKLREEILTGELYVEFKWLDEKV